jgi:predicted MFS family arabinose efflux permease
MAPAVIANEIKLEFSTTSAELGMLSSIYFFVYGFMQIPIGYLADRYSPGKVLGFFLTLAAAGSLMFGTASSFGIAMFARGLTSLGLASTYVTSTKLFGKVFDRKGFILSTGILITVGNIGSMTAASPLAAIVDNLGWRWSFLIMSGITAVIAIASFAILGRKEYSPSSSKVSRGKGGISRFELALSLILGFAVFLKNGPLFSFQGLWGVPYLMDVHALSRIEASTVLMVMSASAALAGALGGSLCRASGMGERRFLDLNAVLYAMSWIPIAIVIRGFVVQSLWITGAVFGVTSTLLAVMMQAVLKDSVAEAGRGVAIGITNGMSILGGAVFQPVMGYILDAAEAGGKSIAAGYSAALMFGLVSVWVSAALFITACHMAKGKEKGCEPIALPEAVS